MQGKTPENWLKWIKFLKTNPTNNELRCIVESSQETDYDRENAGKELLRRQNTSNKDLLCIMELIESLRNETWNKLKNQSPDKEDLRYIIKHLDHSCYEREAKRILYWRYRSRTL